MKDKTTIKYILKVYPYDNVGRRPVGKFYRLKKDWYDGRGWVFIKGSIATQTSKRKVNTWVLDNNLTWGQTTEILKDFVLDTEYFEEVKKLKSKYLNKGK